MNECMGNLATFHVPRPRRALVLAPHPDDEAVGCGGYLAMLADGGTEITVVFVTDGGLDASGCQNDSLAERRRRESQAAMAVLAVQHAVWWGLPDGNLTECAGPAGSVQRLIEDRAIELVLSPHPGEAHPDHAAVARLLADVTSSGGGEPTVMTYEIWTPQLPDCVVDITARMERKLQAVRAYESQLSRFHLEGLVEGLGRYRAAWSRMRGWRFAECYRRFDLAGYRAFCHAN